MNFVPSSEKAKEWGISQRRVAILCKEGRVPGAELVGNRWFLPLDAVKPQDPRKAKKCIFRKNCASVPEERSAIPLQTEQSSAG